MKPIYQVGMRPDMARKTHITLSALDRSSPSMKDSISDIDSQR